MSKSKQQTTTEEPTTKEGIGIDEFFNFKLEKKPFIENKIHVKDNKTGKETLQTYPYTPSSEEIQAEIFFQKTTDPDSGFYHPERDKNGSPIKGTGVTHRVKTIMRVRAKDGKQYLMSFGRLYGFDKYGDQVRIPCTCPEPYKHTFFKYTRRMDMKKEELVSVNLGPSGIETRYTLPFTKENVMALYEAREDTFNSSSGFIVQDLATGGTKDVQVRAVSGDMEDYRKQF